MTPPGSKDTYGTPIATSTLHDGYCLIWDADQHRFVELDITRFGNVLYPLDAHISIPAMNMGQTKFVTVNVPSATTLDSVLIQMQPSTFGNYFVSTATVISNGVVGLGLIAQAHLPAMMLNAQITVITKQTYSQGAPT